MNADKKLDEVVMAVVRKNLDALGAEEELNEDVELNDLGIDSMKSIALLLDLEATLEIVIPDQYLVPESYRNVAAIKKMVRQVIGADDGSPGA